MSIQKLQPLPLVRFRFRFVLNTPATRDVKHALNAGFLGSAWRGAFGHALRRTVCITNLQSCEICSLVESCSYPNLFEPQITIGTHRHPLFSRPPVPYVLEPHDSKVDISSSTHNVGVILFGSAIKKFPDVVSALRIAGKCGLTGSCIRLHLKDVQFESFYGKTWEMIYEKDRFLAPASIVSKWDAPLLNSSIRVKLISPLRIKFGNRLTSEERFTFRAFATSLLRRISLLLYSATGTPLKIDFNEVLQNAGRIPFYKKNVVWHEWIRHSTRQNTKMKMGGLIGSFEVDHHNVRPFLPYLWLGQWTHLGKGCTMGLGRYTIEPIDGSALPSISNCIRHAPIPL